MRPSGTPQELELRRRFAIHLLSQGLSTMEVANQVGADRRSVRRWKAAARRGGAEAVEAKPASGRPRLLTARNLMRLRRLLTKGAAAAGYPTDLWTCPRVASLIEREFNVRYHRAHVSKLMHRLGSRPRSRPGARSSAMKRVSGPG
jgi:putative transposase